MSIKPLPGDVAAQIKSSAVITSLNSVVCGLVKNALDAEATKVHVSVDYTRGNCSVEDNGVGIPPAEFAEGGGLGQLHCTSKFPRRDGVYGKHGTFLASVAALSLLSVASHHPSFSSHNALSIHRSRVVARHRPAPPEQQVLTFAHGTRVTVRDLFGSMPVRVKHRALHSEKSWSSREWDQLASDVVAILLAWPGPVSVFIRDSLGRHSLSFRTASLVGSVRGGPRDPYMVHTARLLHQASLVDTPDVGSWVPIGASAPALLINGCVSLAPVATKRVQFVSLGIEPVSNEVGNNVLYEEVNKMFADSAFGNIDGDGGEDEDALQKLDGFTQRELRAKKGVDRWPMFSLVIGLDSSRRSLHVDDLLDDRQHSLGAIVDLLRAMFFEFLKKHHFSPRDVTLPAAARPRRPRSTAPSEAAASTKTGSRSSRETGGSRERENTTASSTRSRLGRATPSYVAKSRVESPFGSWTRVKAGRDSPSYLKGVEKGGNAKRDAPLSKLASRIASQPRLIDGSGKLMRKPFMDIEPRDLEPEPNRDAGSPEGDTFVWTNPQTRVSSVVDSRTGFVLPPNTGRDLNTAESRFPQTTASLHPNKAPKPEERSEWVQDLLSRWKNPVFELSEPGIPRLPDISDALGADMDSGGHLCHDPSGMAGCARDEASTLTQQGWLTKESLAKAEVIAQVDKKFILARVPYTPVAGEKDPVIGPASFLVLIDQHAADERCRVEALMREYFTVEVCSKGRRSWQAVTEHLEKPLHFELSSKEHDLLLRFRPHFEHWGISYNVRMADAPAGELQSGRSRRAKLTVRSLPPAVLERCRLDPQLLIGVVRKETWRLHDDRSAQVMAEKEAGAECRAGEEREPHGWVRRFHSCPAGILDMVNSRACRGAVMFNDPLTVEQCADLVERLRATAFPFQCAHGRPSMVPILDVGTVVGDADEGLLSQEKADGGFGRRFDRWKAGL